MKKGSKMTLEQRKRLSDSQKGHIPWNKGKKNVYSEEVIKKMGERNKGNKYHLGKHFSEEQKKRISDATKKAMANPEIKKKIGDTSRKLWANPEYKQKHKEVLKRAMNTPEAIRRNSESQKRKWLGAEYRKKMSIVHKGKHSSQKTEFKKGLIPWNVGISPSKESIRKMSETRKRLMNNKEVRKKLSEISRKLWLNPEYRKKHYETSGGEKSRFWKGGISFEPYSLDWTRALKKIIRERDKHTCQICFNKGSQVHHIDYNKKNCNPENLITLCKSCHPKTNLNREKWIKFFESKII